MAHSHFFRWRDLWRAPPQWKSDGIYAWASWKKCGSPRSLEGTHGFPCGRPRRIQGSLRSLPASVQHMSGGRLWFIGWALRAALSNHLLSSALQGQVVPDDLDELDERRPRQKLSNGPMAGLFGFMCCLESPHMARPLWRIRTALGAHAPNAWFSRGESAQDKKWECAIYIHAYRSLYIRLVVISFDRPLHIVRYMSDAIPCENLNFYPAPVRLVGYLDERLK